MSLKTVITKILTHSKRSLTYKEVSFLNNIKDNKSLTEKQLNWLLSITEKTNYSIDESAIPIKKSKPRTKPKSKSKSKSFHCDHEDLGSLGYEHGTTVTCPHCGERTVVW